MTGALKQAGIARRSSREALALAGRVKWTPALEDQAVALYREGMTIVAVAQAIGLSRAAVQVLLAQRNLSRSPSAARRLALAWQRDANLI